MNTDATPIAYLIPEFPGQTHSFFMRERRQLENRGLSVRLISTRPPLNGHGKHTWVRKAARETTWLLPLTPGKICTSIWEILRSGPRAWKNCLSALKNADVPSFSERIKLLGALLGAGNLHQIARTEGWSHIHVHSCANSANVALFAHLLGNFTYSMTLHGALTDYGSNQRAKWSHAKFCITITRELHDFVHQHLEGSLPEHVYIAPMGVDTDHFLRTSPYLPYRDTRKPCRLVSSGRINPFKGHEDAIQAVAILRAAGFPTELRICGASDNENLDYLHKLEDLIAENGLENHVHLLGSVGEEQVRAEIEAADIFVLATRKEALGVSIMEAMSMECPCIVAHNPGIEELIESGVNGMFVPQRDPEAIANAVRGMIMHRSWTRRVSEAGRNTVVQKFHAGISAEAILAGLDGREMETKASVHPLPDANSDDSFPLPQAA